MNAMLAPQFGHAADNQVPDHIRSEIRIECDVTPRHWTIHECRRPWREDLGPDWTRFPIARMRYTKTTGLWVVARPRGHLGPTDALTN